jgi:cytochrome c6
MRTFCACLLVALLATSSAILEAAANAGWDLATGTPSRHGGTRALAIAGRKPVAAFAPTPRSPEPTASKSSSGPTSGAVTSVKVAQLVTALSLALALVSPPSPAWAAAAHDVARGSKLFAAECNVCHPRGQNRMNEPRTLRREALERYQSLDGPELVRHVGPKSNHGLFPFTRYFAPRDYDDVIAYVLDQAIHNKWDD